MSAVKWKKVPKVVKCVPSKTTRSGKGAKARSKTDKGDVMFDELTWKRLMNPCYGLKKKPKPKKLRKMEDILMRCDIIDSGNYMFKVVDRVVKGKDRNPTKECMEVAQAIRVFKQSGDFNISENCKVGADAKKAAQTIFNPKQLQWIPIRGTDKTRPKFQTKPKGAKKKQSNKSVQANKRSIQAMIAHLVFDSKKCRSLNSSDTSFEVITSRDCRQKHKGKAKSYKNLLRKKKVRKVPGCPIYSSKSCGRSSASSGSRRSSRRRADGKKKYKKSSSASKGRKPRTANPLSPCNVKKRTSKRSLTSFSNLRDLDSCEAIPVESEGSRESVEVLQEVKYHDVGSSSTSTRVDEDSSASNSVISVPLKVWSMMFSRERKGKVVKANSFRKFKFPCPQYRKCKP